MLTLDYFQRAYVINLPERRDRRKAVEAQLKKVGMYFNPGKLEIFPGVRPTSAGEFPSIGARGCYMSHLQVLQQARRDNLSNVLILEDDLLMAKDFKRYEASLIEQLCQQKWAFAYFGCPTDRPIAPPVNFVPFNFPVITTHMYGVNGTIFDRLIDFLELLASRPSGHPEGGPMHLDGAYNLFRQNNPDVIGLKTNSSIVAQSSSRSDVYPNAWYDRTPVTRPLVNLARMGKTFIRSQQANLG